MDHKQIEAITLIALQLIRHLRAKRVGRGKLLRDVVFRYASACGGWKRAFPSSINGDVALPFHFDFEMKPDYWVEENMRLPRNDIDRVRRLLGIPDVVVTHNRDSCPGFWAFCMLLYKLSWPRRMSDLRDCFGGTKQRCGRLVNHVAVFLYRRFGPKLNGLDRARYSDQYLLRLCDIVHRQNGVMDNIWGFIDATIRPCARPVRFQKVMFNGKNHVHSIKFQSVVSWDGMIAHMCGPWAGARHDSGIFAESGLPSILETLPFVSSPGTPAVALYADDGYALSRRVFVPYPDGRVNARHAAFNQTLSQSRITVEWSYHKILSSWTALDFKRNLKIFKSPIAVYYMVATLLTNIQSCLNTYNEITLYSGYGRTPTVEDYLQTLACE